MECCFGQIFVVVFCVVESCVVGWGVVESCVVGIMCCIKLCC